MVKSSPLILLLRKPKYKGSKELAPSHTIFPLHVHIGCFPYSCRFINQFKFTEPISLILALGRGRGERMEIEMCFSTRVARTSRPTENTWREPIFFLQKEWCGCECIGVSTHLRQAFLSFCLHFLDIWSDYLPGWSGAPNRVSGERVLGRGCRCCFDHRRGLRRRQWWQLELEAGLVSVTSWGQYSARAPCRGQRILDMTFWMWLVGVHRSGNLEKEKGQQNVELLSEGLRIKRTRRRKEGGDCDLNVCFVYFDFRIVYRQEGVG